MGDGTKVLVTGAAGYLGSVLCTYLLDAGFKVTAVDSLLFGSKSLSQLKNKKNLELKKLDIRKTEKLRQLVKNQDSIIHLAGLVGDAACNSNSQLAVDINYQASRNLADIAKQEKVKRFIFASTCSVYGYSNKISAEKDTVNPVSVYGMSKVLAEQYLLTLAAKDFSTTIFRMATLYGWSPRMRFDLVVNQFAAQASVGDRITLYAGNQWRPFIHVKDAARAFLTCLTTSKNKINGEIFNVSDRDQNIQIYELALLIKKIIPGSKIFKDKGIKEPRNYTANAKKIENVMNFRSQISLEKGIFEIYQEFKKSKRYENYRDQKFTSFIKLSG